MTDKVTHQGRKQSQIEMERAGVPNALIIRIAGYSGGGEGASKKRQSTSYLTCPPVKAVIN